MRTFILASFLSSLTLFGHSLQVQGQVPVNTSTSMPRATSQEEYNYATKGLKVQRANGLDMKTGYSLSNPTTMAMGSFTVTIEDLIRTGEGTLACSVVEVSAVNSPSPVWPLYFCIPNPGSPGEIWSQYAKAQQQYTSLDMLRAVSYCLSTRLSAMTTAAMMKK